MKFIFLTCASAQEDWAEQAISNYTQKIKPFVPFEVKNLKLKKSGREEAEVKKKNDSDQILKEIDESDFIVLFDEKGETLDSKAFSQKLNQVLLSGKKRIVWIIGGAYGVDDRVKARANLKISFSKMVMNHLVAQTVALEQIYRGFAILKNLPYHNE
jgi:23S rRNA (pseudouridine1915-N3)-methyltransferase